MREDMTMSNDVAQGSASNLAKVRCAAAIGFCG